MGGGKSKSKSETLVETEVVNDTTFNALNRSENAVSATVIAVQDMTVSGIKAYCNLKIGQKINADIKVLQSFKGEDTKNLINDLMGDIEKEAENAAKQETGFGNPFGGNNSELVSKTKTSIKNKLTKNITNETINKLQAKVVLKQKLRVKNLIIDPCGIGVYKELGVPPPVELIKACVMAKPCEIGQDMVIKFVAEQMGQQITKIINEDKNAQKLSEKLKQSTDQKTQGAGDAIGDISRGFGEGVGTAVGGKGADGSVGGVGAGVGDAAEGVGSGVGTAAEGVGAGVGSAMGGAMMPSLISGCVVCVIVAGGAAFMMSPAGQKAAGNMGKMGKGR
jgi:hypothetical protein